MSKQIEISDQTYQEIAAIASDVSAFVEQAAKEALADPSFEPFTEADRQASEEIIARGEADLAAGRTQDMEDALLNMGEKRGYALDG